MKTKLVAIGELSEDTTATCPNLDTSLRRTPTSSAKFEPSTAVSEEAKGRILIMGFSATSPAPDSGNMLRLTKGLERMRDSLVELSLILRDIQFESDTHHRTEASRSAAQMLQKIGASRGDSPP